MDIWIFLISCFFILAFIFIGLKVEPLLSAMGGFIGIFISLYAMVEGITLSSYYNGTLWVFNTVNAFPFILIPMMLTIVNFLIVMVKRSE